MNEEKCRKDRQQLVMDIAEETGLKVTQDDPVRALIVVHEVVLDAYEQRWRQHVRLH